MINLDNLEKKINSELATKINKTEIKRDFNKSLNEMYQGAETMFGRIEPNAKIPKAIHLFTLAQYSCTLSVIITHPRVIKSTLRSIIERV